MLHGAALDIPFLNFLFTFMLPFRKTLQSNFNYASTPNNGKVIKFCNLGDQSFETDLVVKGQSVVPDKCCKLLMNHLQFYLKSLQYLVNMNHLIKQSNE